MIPPSTYTANCWRDGSRWLVHVPELGRTAAAPDLSQVDEVARRLVAESDGTPRRAKVELVVRHGSAELLAAAAAARDSRDRMSVEAVTLRRCLARRLAEEGFGVPDVAALLGLSYGRALQLVGDGGGVHAGVGRSGPTQPGGGDRDGAARPRVPRVPAARPGLHDTVQHQEPTVPRGPAHSTYRHEAFLYRGERELLAGTVPFVTDGVALGQPVVVALHRQRLERLRGAVEEDVAEHVVWLDMAEMGRNPARLLPARREFVEQHVAAGVPVRGVGEPVWTGRRAAEVAECQLHEALLNLAVDPDVPFWLRCPYDVEALPPDVVEEAARSHPLLVDGDGYLGSTLYGGAAHVDDLFRARLPDPQHRPVEQLHFDEDGVERVRHAVLRRAGEVGVGAARRHDLALAVTEVATNSVRHGGGHGCLRIWRDDGALVCEVSDPGRIDDAMVGRTMPPLLEEGGRGLWLANQLADLVQIRSTQDGVVVRVHGLIAA